MLVCHLGRVEYRACLDLQLRLRSLVQEGGPEVLLLLEHDPVYTRGRRTTPGELPMGEDWYRTQGIDVVDTPRGGKATYHGPGQLVGYPIVRVRDIPDYICAIERSLVAALAASGVAGAECRSPTQTGVWVGDRKIASIGVHVSHGVSTHGFAVNVEGDLQPWSWIVPCGMDAVRMTSVALESRLDSPPAPAGARLAEFVGVMADAFCAEFSQRPEWVGAAELESAFSKV